MTKSKLCGLFAVCLLSAASITPYTAFATNEDNTATTREHKDSHKDKTTYDEQLNQFLEKWDSLSDKQRKEVYELVEKEMVANFKVMEKLCNLGILSADELTNYKAMMKARFKQIVDNKEFPYGPSKKQNHK